MADAKLRLGGMALDNGLLVHGPTHWAVAIRAEDGSIKTASGRKPHIKGVEKIPGVRGVVRMAEAMAVIPLAKRALPEAKLPYQDRSTLATVIASALLGSTLKKRIRGPLRRELAVGMIGLAPALFSLRRGELAEYHGAEHKTIAAYEQGNQQTAGEVDKEHDRCGSHLVAPLLAANIAGATVLLTLVERPNALQGAAVGVASLATAVEVFIWSESHADRPLARLLRKPGFELQRVVGTREPSAEQLEVGQAALEEILQAEGVTLEREQSSRLPL